VSPALECELPQRGPGVVIRLLSLCLCVWLPAKLAWAVGDAGAGAPDGGGLPDGGGSIDASAGNDAVPPPATSPLASDAAAAIPPALVRVPTIVLRGRVLGKGSREPLAGASVTVDAVPAAETDGTGRFEVPVLPGRRHLQIQQPGYQPLDVAVEATRDARETVFRLMPRQTGERYETVVSPPDEHASRTTLREEELRQVPGSFGDPFRVVESLPGVSQVIWPAAVYAIRGANPGNTGFFLDGVRVPALFHFALGPSVIHPFFLDQIDFYPGGYPAQYGRYVSGIVSARTVTPATDRTHVSADVRLFDAGGIVATPLDDGQGAVAVAGRLSYTGLLFSLLATDIVFTYWDYQLRLEHKLGNGRLTLFAFGSGDVLRGSGEGSIFSMPGMIGPEDQTTRAELSFHRLDLRWDGSVLGGKLQASALVGRDSSVTSIEQLVTFPVSVTMLTAAPRLFYTHALASWADLETGADLEAQRFRPRSDLPNATDQDLFRDRDAISAGAFVGMTLRRGTRLSIAPAMRYEWFSEQGENKFEPSPRLTVRVRPAGDVWIKTSVGRYAQLASLPVAVPGFEAFGLASYGTQTSLQGSLGVEGPLSANMTFEVTGFYQRLRLTDLESIFQYDIERQVVELRDGESYGAEVLLRRSLTKRLYGWLAYTLSRSDRLVGYYRKRAPSDWDQRHIVNLVLGYRMRGGWATSGRLHYNTGRPYPVSDERAFRVDYRRLPPFFQLDVRVDKQFIFDRFLLSAYLELVNTTLSREVFDLRVREDGALTDRGYRIVLPSIGVHAEW
jgi:hypothetical protein